MSIEHKNTIESPVNDASSGIIEQSKFPSADNGSAPILPERAMNMNTEVAVEVTVASTTEMVDHYMADCEAIQSLIADITVEGRGSKFSIDISPGAAKSAEIPTEWSPQDGYCFAYENHRVWRGFFYFATEADCRKAWALIRAWVVSCPRPYSVHTFANIFPPYDVVIDAQVVIGPDYTNIATIKPEVLKVFYRDGDPALNGYMYDKILDDEFLESFAKKTAGMLKVTPKTRVRKWIAESFWSNALSGTERCLGVAGWYLTDAGWARNGEVVVLGPDIPHGLDSVDDGVDHYFLVNAAGERIESNGFDTRKYKDAMNAVESALTTAINEANFERINEGLKKSWTDATYFIEPQNSPVF